MIIGSGLLSKAFKKKEDKFKDYIIFASGVSSSRQVKVSEFDREKELLLSTIIKHNDLTFIYFSCILINDNKYKNKYYLHKYEMEKLIKAHTKKYIIFRIPQIVGCGGNSDNLFNYMRDALLSNKTIGISGEIRSIIDVEDLVEIVSYCKGVSSRKIISVAGIKSLSVIKLVYLIAKELDCKPIIKKKLRLRIPPVNVNCKVVDNAISELKINKSQYVESVVKKYAKCQMR